MIRNCFNYVGSKDRIFPLINRNLDKSKPLFVDLFCGSAVVGINEVSSYKKVLLNDACWQIIYTLRYFRDNKYEDIIDGIDSIINGLDLSKENKDGYNQLRELYNNVCCNKEDFNPLVFYTLVMHSFNYNIHINKSGGFSVPFGKGRSYFNSSLRDKFKSFQQALSISKNDIAMKSKNFVDIIKSAENVMDKVMFYCDPPYLSSDSAYGRVHYLGKWDEEKEETLLEGLDYIHSKGGSFLLSNVLENNGKVNSILTDWARNYKIIYVPVDYDNCNYQRKNSGETREVLIRNY